MGFSGANFHHQVEKLENVRTVGCPPGDTSQDKIARTQTLEQNFKPSSKIVIESKMEIVNTLLTLPTVNTISEASTSSMVLMSG